MNMHDVSIVKRICTAAIAFSTAAVVTMVIGDAAAWEKQLSGHQVVQDWRRQKPQKAHKLTDIIDRDTLIKNKDVKVPSQILCKNGGWVRECEAWEKGDPGDLVGPCKKWTKHWACNLPVVR